MFITRRERFSAAHRLFRKDWSDDKNFEVFGQCSNPNWHGHNYTLYVTIEGIINAETGFVTNLKNLSNLIHKKIINKVDHKNLNLEVDFLKEKIVSTENIAKAIWEELAKEVEKEGARLHCVKLVETENNFVEYYGN
jgi:6-pyruvoyltetrahydropterin/6-carboxytetrahydropterin synthase